MNNYCLRNWRLVKTGIHSSKNYWKLNGCLFCILQQTNFVRFFKVRSLIKTRYGPCMELSPERVTTTKELSGQKLRKFSCEFYLEPFWWDYTTRDVTHKSRKMIDTHSIWVCFCTVKLWKFITGNWLQSVWCFYWMVSFSIWNDSLFQRSFRKFIDS